VDSWVLAEFDVRVVALGKDRDNNLYWAFQLDHEALSLRIFCEYKSSVAAASVAITGQHTLPAWEVFSHE
jgi:hypothetical protein